MCTTTGTPCLVKCCLMALQAPVIIQIGIIQNKVSLVFTLEEHMYCSSHYPNNSIKRVPHQTTTC